jgi:hypothetical protein
MDEITNYKGELFDIIDKNVIENQIFLNKTIAFLNFFESLDYEYKIEKHSYMTVDVGITLFSFFPSAINQMKEIIKCILIGNKVSSYATIRILIENYILLVFLFQNLDCCESYFNWSICLGSKKYKKNKATNDKRFKKIISDEIKKINIASDKYKNKEEKLFSNDYGWAYAKILNKENINLSIISKNCVEEEYIYNGEEYNKFSKYSEYTHSNNIITKEVNKSFLDINKLELLHEINENICGYLHIYARLCESGDEQYEKFATMLDELKLLLTEIEAKFSDLINNNEFAKI